MIIATIGHQEYLLETLQDANALLDILNRAKNIGHVYDRKTYRELYFEQHGTTVKIEVVGADLVSEDEALARSSNKPLEAVEAAA